VLLHDSARPHTAAHTQPLLKHFSWELFDHSYYSLDLAPSNCRLFTYLKNLFGSHCFNSNEKLMECIKTWQSSQAYKNLFTDTTSASIPVVTTLRSSLSMYEFFICHNFFSSLLVLLTSNWRLLFE
jgi:hypothetical protein